MSEEINKLILESTPNQERTNELLGRLFEITKPEAVYSQPVTAGEYTVVTASEVTAAFGAGFGGGVGAGPEKEEAEPAPLPGGFGGGGGGGGGGSALARPVAAIVIGPDGVQVQPILDPTKFGLAIVTAVGAMFLALARMKKASQ